MKKKETKRFRLDSSRDGTDTRDRREGGEPRGPWCLSAPTLSSSGWGGTLWGEHARNPT